MADVHECPRCGAFAPTGQPLVGHVCIRPQARVHHHRDLRVPAGYPDYIGLQPLIEVTITPGLEVTYDGRPAVVCVPPPSDHLGPKIGEYVLIRYLDGKRERVLANPYDCAVGTDL